MTFDRSEGVEQYWRCQYCDFSQFSAERPKCPDHNLAMIADEAANSGLVKDRAERNRF